VCVNRCRGETFRSSGDQFAASDVAALANTGDGDDRLLARFEQSDGDAGNVVFDAGFFEGIGELGLGG
jgi:hypothetical protein